MEKEIIKKDQGIHVRHIVPGKYIETYVGSIFYINKEIESKVYPTKNGFTTTVRQFELLCGNCKEPKNCLASSIVMKKIRCLACAKITKAQLDNVIAIGNIVKNRYNEAFLIDKFISEEKVKYNTGTKYRYFRTYEIICMKCETLSVVTNSAIWNGSVTCKNCRGIKGETNLRNISAERKTQNAAEIDKIFSEMMEMARNNTLVDYLLNKFKIDFKDIEDKQEPKYEATELNEDYDDVEIDNDIEDMFNEYEN